MTTYYADLRLKRGTGPGHVVHLAIEADNFPAASSNIACLISGWWAAGNMMPEVEKIGTNKTRGRDYADIEDHTAVRKAFEDIPYGTPA